MEQLDRAQGKLEICEKQDQSTEFSVYWLVDWLVVFLCVCVFFNMSIC